MDKKEKIMDHRTSEAGMSNWETCHRMLIHDLLDMRAEVKSVDALLRFYQIEYSNGAYTMALPRLKVLEKSGHTVSSKARPKEKKAR